jgi:hypothetical protein
MTKSITIQNIHISIRTLKAGDDFICLTDMAKNAIGIRSSAGRYGGTYAHKDIAFEFAIGYHRSSNYIS